MAKKKKGTPKRAQTAHESLKERKCNVETRTRGTARRSVPLEHARSYWSEWANEEEGDWDDYRTFEEWHRESMRRIAEKRYVFRDEFRGGGGMSSEEEGQQLYVLLFLRAFTMWDEADIRPL